MLYSRGAIIKVNNKVYWYYFILNPYLCIINFNRSTLYIIIKKKRIILRNIQKILLVLGSCALPYDTWQYAIYIFTLVLFFSKIICVAERHKFLPVCLPLYYLTGIGIALKNEDNDRNILFASSASDEDGSNDKMDLDLDEDEDITITTDIPSPSSSNPGHSNNNSPSGKSFSLKELGKLLLTILEEDESESNESDNAINLNSDSDSDSDNDSVKTVRPHNSTSISQGTDEHTNISSENTINPSSSLPPTVQGSSSVNNTGPVVIDEIIHEYREQMDDLIYSLTDKRHEANDISIRDWTQRLNTYQNLHKNLTGSYYTPAPEESINKEEDMEHENDTQPYDSEEGGSDIGQD